MSNPSNLYAEKVFAEHPLSLWALDDQADYISLISDSNRSMSQWTITGGTLLSASDTSISDEPFTTSPVAKLRASSLVVGTSGQIKLVSPTISTAFPLSTISTGVWLNSASYYISSYDIGYSYVNPLTSATVEKVKNFKTSSANEWIFISDTTELPSGISAINMIIKINFQTVSSSTSDYIFYLNGPTLGQECEEFAPTSLGVFSSSVPSSISGITATGVIEAASYGLSGGSGYYLVNNNKMLAKNTGVPMVYGASGITKIIPSSGAAPSLIIPGCGFLNESGRHREYTFEMWLRINPVSTAAKRIFGPIASDDGLYIDGEFLTLKVGDYSDNYFIGEWFRPMLVDIKFGNGSASVLINGEQVLFVQFPADTVSLPSQTDESGDDQDWLGFYSYSDISVYDVDCVAIYTYQVPQLVAKRRWAYGQAVEFPENTNTSFGGTSIYVDYPFADYTKNYTYPDIGRWAQGVSENLSIKRGALSTPEYELPDVRFKTGKSVETWLSEIEGLQGPTKSLFFEEDDAYILIKRFNLSGKPTKAIYGIFEVEALDLPKQILIKIENNNSGDYLYSYIENDIITYAINIGGIETVLYTETVFAANEKFFVGLNLNNLVRAFGNKVSTFFGSVSQLIVYIAGQSSFTNTFTGKIYKVGFSTQRNLNKISSNFNQLGSETFIPLWDGGSPQTSEWTTELDGGLPSSFSIGNVIDHTATYTLVPTTTFGNLSIDIATDSYWQDHIPLTYFAQYVTNSAGEKLYDIDFIQFNIGYPAFKIFKADTLNPIVGGGKVYDTSDSTVKTYITFQYLNSGANASKDSFTYEVGAHKNGVLEPGSYVVANIGGTNIYDDIMTTRYEVVNGTIIYLPKNISLENLAIVTHIDVVSSGVVSKNINIKSLEYASESFNESTSNPVNTRFGIPMFPYKKYGSYYDYKAKNPYRIYKGSTPYLYLTSDSGIEKVGDYDSLVNRGLTVPINQNLATTYKVIAMQAFIKYGKESFPTDPVQIFELESKDSYIKFFIQAQDAAGKRGRVYGINSKTGLLESNVKYYWNGKMVRQPVMNIDEWGILGINFSRILDFDSFSGGFRITGDILINNISQYQSTSLQEEQKQTTRPWTMIEVGPLSSLDWKFWDTSYNWNGALVLSTSKFYGIDPSDIYKVYTGTNKIIVNDSKTLTFNNCEYKVYKDIVWKTVSSTAI